jgi:hypothetical protein
VGAFVMTLNGLIEMLDDRVQRRMSLIVLILLFTFCTCGSGTHQQTTVYNIDVGHPTTTSTLVSRDDESQGSDGERSTDLQNTPSTYKRTTTIFAASSSSIGSTLSIKTTSRSKLWSPYSTLGDFIEENDEEQFPQSFKNPLSKVDFTTPVEMGAKGGGEPEATSISVENDARPVQKLPIISSIRHFRSRKSFVRTRKNPTEGSGAGDISSVSTRGSSDSIDARTNNNLQSEPTVRGSHVDVTDLVREQGDQPYYLPISTATTSSVPQNYTSGTKAFKYGKVVEEKANTGRENSGISSENDMGAVYGIPYFTRTTGRNSTNSSSNLKKINKAFLVPKREKNNVSESSGRGSQRPGIGTTELKITSRRKGNNTDGTGTERQSAGFRKNGLLLLESAFTPAATVHSDETHHNASKDYHQNRDKSPIDSTGGHQPTKKPRRKSGTGGGGGKKSHEKSDNSTRKAKIEGEVLLSIHESTSSSNEQEIKQPRVSSQPEKPSGLERKRPGSETYSQQHVAFRKVKEKQRIASRFPDTQGKSDYKSNYDQNAHSDNNDLPSQLPQSGDGGESSDSSSFSIQQQQQSNTNDKTHYSQNMASSQDYFPSSFGKNGSLDSGEETSYFENNGMYEVELSRAPVFDGEEEYDTPADSTSSSPTSSSLDSEIKPEIDIVRAFLNIVESQHLLGDNCTRGTEYNLGEGVVDRYAQERFRLEAELTVNRANMLTRFWKYAEPKTLDDEYLLHAMVISLIEFDEDIFAAGNCYDENQYKNYTLFCPYGYREKDGSILVKDLSLEYPYLSNTSEWFYKAKKDGFRVVRNYNQFRRGKKELLCQRLSTFTFFYFPYIPVQ